MFDHIFLYYTHKATHATSDSEALNFYIEGNKYA